jgi:MFS family permease
MPTASPPVSVSTQGSSRASLWILGVLLARYDGAAILLKPVFGPLADRIGPRPVFLGGLLAFTIASAGYVVVGNPALLGVVRLGQGVAAAAFSPPPARWSPACPGGNRRGRVFGGYGAFKSLGYAAGPIVGGLLITAGGTPCSSPPSPHWPWRSPAGPPSPPLRGTAGPAPANRPRPRTGTRLSELPANPRSPWPETPPPWPSGGVPPHRRRPRGNDTVGHRRRRVGAPS